MTPVKARIQEPENITPAEAPWRNKRKSYSSAWIPYVLALLFFLSALRGIGNTDVIDTDAARHAMNGAFIYDLLRTGHWSSPVEYAKAYYGQYPALSMPFHPPLFPAIEALFYAVFGVKLASARLAVALSVALCAVLLYRLVQATLGRASLAVCVTVTTFSVWTVQFVARDVMLEFPAMVFTLAAVYCLRDLDTSFPIRRAILFAIFSAAAVWTKQHTVFLGAVPFIHALLTRRWRRFVEAPVWIGTAIFAAAVLGIIWLSKMFHGTGVNQMSTSTSDVYWILTKTLPAYFRWIVEALKGLPGVFSACAIITYVWGTRKRDQQRPKLSLYVAWIIALCALLIDLGPVTPRYLFFLLPAVIAIAYAWLFHGCRWLWGKRSANFVIAGFALAWFVAGLFIPLDFLRGPAAAAGEIVRGGPARVLYAGAADGNFVFAARALDPNLQVTIIPARKIPRKTFEETTVESFCRQYGIEWVIFEHVPGRQFWSSFHAGLNSGNLQRRIPLESTRTRWQSGVLEVYRFPVPRNHPGGVLQLPVPNIGATIPVRL
jgi:4-amino-4-deoxy-L-arabinose transferase-like glycosyltransferase